MPSWKSVDKCPPPLGETVLLRGKGGGIYLGRAYETPCCGVMYKTPSRWGSVQPVWWCPIPEFDGEEGR